MLIPGLLMLFDVSLMFAIVLVPIAIVGVIAFAVMASWFLAWLWSELSWRLTA